MVQVWCLARRLEWAWGSKYVRPIWRTMAGHRGQNKISGYQWRYLDINWRYHDIQISRYLKVSRYLGRKSGGDILTPLQIYRHLATERPGVKPGDCAQRVNNLVLDFPVLLGHPMAWWISFQFLLQFTCLRSICFCVNNFPGKPEPKKILFFSSRTERLAIALSPFIHTLLFLLRARFPSETPFSSLCRPSSRDLMTNTESLADSRIQL